MELRTDSRVVKNLLRKRDLLLQRDPAHEQIRTALVILGGGMRGASGGGIGIAFHALGLGDVFDVVVGVSTGAPVAAYFLAGPKQMALGASIYYQDLPPRFIRYCRRPIVDIDFLESVFRTGSKKLDVGSIRKHRSKFYVAVTKTSSGEGVLLNAKRISDLVTVIKASTALPGLYGRSVSVNDELFIDGGVGNPFPAREVVERFRPTDLLVIANHPLRAMRGDGHLLVERILAPLLLRNTPPRVKKATLNRQYRFREAYKFLESTVDLNWGILYSPDDGTHLLTRDSSKLRMLARASAQNLLKVFGEQTMQVKLL